MASRTIKEILNLADGIKDGMELEITNFEIGKDTVGKFATIVCADGKKYRTYGKYVMEALVNCRDEMKFPFGNESLTCTVKEITSSNDKKYLNLV
jgi:hypothetical protein